MKKMFDILKQKMFPRQKSCNWAFSFARMLFWVVILTGLSISNVALGDDGWAAEAANLLALYEGAKEEKNLYDQLPKVTWGDDYYALSNIKNLQAMGISDTMNLLRTYANEQGHYDVLVFGDAEVTNAAQDLVEAIQDAVSAKKLTEAEANTILQEAERIIREGGKKDIEIYEKTALNPSRVSLMESHMNRAISELYEYCPNIATIRAKYTSGCWSCMVIERLTASFMTAAEKGIEVSKKAGIVLLKVGALIWIALWGLRVVSSMTQIEPANILNELFKFCFKIMLAFAFIQNGMSMVSKYFINPIMGAGAKIAHAYWEEDRIKSSVEEYTWGDEDYEEIEKEEKEAFDALEKGSYSPIGVTRRIISVKYEEGQQALIDAQKELDKENLVSQDIPTFLIPGTNVGRLTSPFGCRIRPKVGCAGNAYKDASGQCYGSAAHKGIDIGTQGKEGGVVFAIAGGTITYNGGPNSTAGYYASIRTKDKHGNTWTHRYLHMQPRSHTDFWFPDNIVAAGQQIGYIGNTGVKGGAHLHLDIMFNGTWKGKKYEGVYVDPLRLSQGVFYTINFKNCTGKKTDPFPDNFAYHQAVPQTPWKSPKTAYVDLSSTYVQGSASGSDLFSSVVVNFPMTTYKGPVGLISKSVMNSILGATKAIGDILAENMVLGDAIMCYSKLENGGAWTFEKWDKVIIKFTNVFLWLEGAFIWCTGFLLTVAFVFYLLDIAFKIGFAAMALPLAVGLWPFEITKDKVGICVSIIAKAAATFAFIAMTTTFIVNIHEAVFNYEMDNTGIENAENSGVTGLARLYESFDKARTGDASEADLDYVSQKLGFFEVTFVLLLFAFLYSYKLLQQTVPNLVDKFFPDKAFGNSSPMHHMATAAVKAGKDIAMKPVGWARDAALYQGGRGLNKGIGWIARKLTGKGKKEDDKKDGGEK